MSVITRFGRRLSHGSIALAVVAVALQAVPAAAALPAPVITGPVGSTATTFELTWEPVDGATGYEVRVDNDPLFGTPEWSATTVNTVSVPTRMFAPGEQTMQVRAKGASNTSGDWTTNTFTVDSGSAPTLISPEEGDTLEQPDEPPLLVWTPVQGATSYTVEVDTESAFVSPLTYPTEATSLVVPDNQPPGVTYFWRVRATLNNGVATAFSDHRSYVVGALEPPVIQGPANDLDITDVVLDWDPVPGAKHYELQVDDDFDFSSVETAGVPAKIFGTRFSPATTFGNDQYFWRVRARDLDDNPTQWEQIAPDVHYAFDRVWRDVPELVYPYDGSTTADLVQFVENDLYYEWKPVPHASHYEIQLSTDVNFTQPSPNTSSCEVAGTTYTPGEHGDKCMPRSEGIVYYWRVRPMDLPYAPAGIDGIYSTPQRFVYTDQDAFSITAPVEGSTVAIPTLDWAPVAGTESYEVKLVRANGTSVTTKKTRSTSFTPLGVALDPADGPFRYTLRAFDADDRTTKISEARSFNVSTEPLDSTTPLVPVVAPATYDAPNLQWGPVAGADHYRIEIGNAATPGTWFATTSAPILSEELHYPAATDISTAFLADGTYNWRVAAYDQDGIRLGVPGQVGTFEVMGLGPVTGQRLALTGSSLDVDNACTDTLPAICEGVPATPVLDWDPVPYASEYRVHVSRNADFTNSSLDATPPHTVNTRWAPTFAYPFKALPDSVAQTPYYWFIQPCKSESQCGPDPRSVINPAHHAFKKVSPRVPLLSPAPDDDGTTADDITTTEITFTWADYYATNRATTYAATGELGYQSAMSYQFQIDDQDTFASPLETVTVDQPTYTSAAELYPEGPLYWRVQPIDVAGNALGWSDRRTVVKSSPAPTLVSPVATPAAPAVPVVNGSVPFRWEPQAYASSYIVQVAANADRNFSTANLEVNKSSKRPAFTTGVGGVATLQASAQPYVWRVRRVDSFNNLGPWSAIGEFKVQLDQPTMLSPDAGAVVGSRGVVMRWSAVAQAAKYRVEYRKVGAAVPTPVTTPATSFAPPAALNIDTTYEWRVASVDVDGRSSAPEGWRTFTVGGTPKATTPASIDGSGVFATTLTAVPPTWSVPGVDNAYQWHRAGSPIPGATSSTHDVVAADVDKPITVVVTGTSVGFGTGTSTSQPVFGKPGAGPLVVTPPAISGTGEVGLLLISTAPTWDPAGVTTSYQWLRDGTDISGATDTTYTVVAADLNAAITLRATGTLPGRTPTVSVSNAIGAGQGAAPTATSAPTITGTPKVGLRITAGSPSWSLPGVQETRQWLRNGQAIPGETAVTYLVRAEDVNAALTVRFTGRLPGRGDGSAVSAPVTGLPGDPAGVPMPAPVQPAPLPTSPTTAVPTAAPAPAPAKVTSTITFKVAKTVKVGAKALARLKVAAAGISSPTGTIKIKAGRKVVARITLKAGAGGIAKVKLAKLPQGRYKLRAVYAGATGIAGSKSALRILKVLP